MNRRNALKYGGGLGLGTLAGCASLQGMIFGRIPKKYKIQNDRHTSVEVEVAIEGDHKQLLSKTFTLAANKSLSQKWPNTKAETYTIEATVDGISSASTFNPADWKKRHTPIIRVFSDGVEVNLN
ncbi:hypothetical protein ACFFQF_22275 [Haladaptatus pallidirubidus]|uniref:Tat (Twin-arginine translocation) pathway signal sequence n=1 Tax=Haladaptatus pallidirubidus TaxID=1008152 RepID=A0AAV3UNP9_9EURY|nr:hypothetical protein [Haladaptatus pallidirubidus]